MLLIFFPFCLAQDKHEKSVQTEGAAHQQVGVQHGFRPCTEQYSTVQYSTVQAEGAAHKQVGVQQGVRP